MCLVITTYFLSSKKLSIDDSTLGYLQKKIKISMKKRKGIKTAKKRLSKPDREVLQCYQL